MMNGANYGVYPPSSDVLRPAVSGGSSLTSGTLVPPQPQVQQQHQSNSAQNDTYVAQLLSQVQDQIKMGVPLQYGPLIVGPGGKREKISPLEKPFAPFVPPKLSGPQREALERARRFALENNVLLRNAAQSAALLAGSRLIGGLATLGSVNPAFTGIGAVSNSPMLGASLAAQRALVSNTGPINILPGPTQIPSLTSLLANPPNAANNKSFLEQATSQMSQQQAALNLRRIQALTLLCRIYIGSINYEVREETIRRAFEAFGPIRSLAMSYDSQTQRHKGFSFLEYEVPEAAVLSIEQMQTAQIGGRTLKVGRPSNLPQAQQIIEDILQEGAPYRRVYIANIHADLGVNDVRSVFGVFGPINWIRLPADPLRPSRHRGFSYLEFEKVENADDAVKAMNLFDLGGMQLRVTKALTSWETIAALLVPMGTPTAALIKSGANNTNTSCGVLLVGSDDGTNSSSPSANGTAVETGRSSGMPGHVPPQPSMTNVPIGVQPPAPTAAPFASTMGGVLPSSTGFPSPHQSFGLSAPSATASSTAHLAWSPQLSSYAHSDNDETRPKSPENLFQDDNSTVIVLKNMVGPEDIDEELESEVKEECAKYGPVERLIIYLAQGGSEVLVFVQFLSIDSAQCAISSLNGRFFGGRRIEARFFSRLLFDQRRFE